MKVTDPACHRRVHPLHVDRTPYRPLRRPTELCTTLHGGWVGDRGWGSLSVSVSVKDWLLVPNGPNATVLEYSSVPVRVLSSQAIKRDMSSTWRAINTVTKFLSPLNGNFLSEPALDVFNVHFMFVVFK